MARKCNARKKILSKMRSYPTRMRIKEEKKQKGIARAKESWAKEKEALKAIRWSSMYSYYPSY